MQVKFKERILVSQLTVADTFFGRLRGLLGRKDYSPGEGLLIKPCNWVHTFGMRFPIDVLFLDSKGAVVAVESLPPNRMGRPHRSAAALELPQGTVERYGIKAGDELQIIV